MVGCVETRRRVWQEWPKPSQEPFITFFNKGLVFLFHSFFFSWKKVNIWFFSSWWWRPPFAQTQTSKTLFFLFRSWTGATCDQRWMIVSMILNKMRWNEAKYAVWGVMAYLHQIPFVWFSLFPLMLFFFWETHEVHTWQQGDFVAHVTMTIKSVLLRRLQVSILDQGLFSELSWSPSACTVFVRVLRLRPTAQEHAHEWPRSVRYCERLPVCNPIFAQRLLEIDSGTPQGPWARVKQSRKKERITEKTWRSDSGHYFTRVMRDPGSSHKHAKHTFKDLTKRRRRRRQTEAVDGKNINGRRSRPQLLK